MSPTTFLHKERVEAVDTVSGIWREATLLEAESDLGPFRIQFDFSKGRDPVDRELTETCKQPDGRIIKVIRKLGDQTMTKKRRGSRSSRLPPTTRGETMMQATQSFGYTDQQLGYNPETKKLLELVSNQLCFLGS